MHVFACGCVLVSAENVEKSLRQMERQLLQLERDLETFSSPDDPNDMFFPKMEISFSPACMCLLHCVSLYRVEQNNFLNLNCLHLSVFRRTDWSRLLQFSNLNKEGKCKSWVGRNIFPSSFAHLKACTMNWLSSPLILSSLQRMYRLHL